ncbi:MAG: LPS export ABC transporter periplasmic protein LptC [Pseudomonadota bacterium]|nr:LPS export ABC transporter periplasmic protein LptC [Pseudomonadota bacterium]
MTFEANHTFAGAGAGRQGVPSHAALMRAFDKAARHTRLVRILRIGLPLLALLVFSLYLFSGRLTVTLGDMQASVERVEIRKDTLRMVNPKLEGANQKQGQYVITADYAEQDVGDPNTIRLTNVKSEMTESKRGWSRLSAPKGVFHTKLEQLELLGGIDIASSNGMKAHLLNASVDLRTQIVKTNDPVDVEFLNGTIRSDRMDLGAQEKWVIFRDRVRVHIHKRPTKPVDEAAEILGKAKGAAQ